jgi:hypothetical protein
MIPPHLRPGSVRPLYHLFLEIVVSHLLNCSSGFGSISMQRAEDTAGHLTDVLSVRSDTGPVRRVHGVERRHRTWHAITPLAAWCICSIHVFSGDKSNHVPSLHPPQLYYYIAFAMIMGWPALISGDSGWKMLVNDVQGRIIGNRRCVLIVNAWCEDLNCSPLIRRMMAHIVVAVAMGLSIKLFTWVRVTLERIPLTSNCAESTTLFYFRTIDITHFMSGDGSSYCTPSYRTCSSRVTSCVHGYGSCVWVRTNVLPRC